MIPTQSIFDHLDSALRELDQFVESGAEHIGYVEAAQKEIALALKNLNVVEPSG